MAKGENSFAQIVNMQYGCDWNGRYCELCKRFVAQKTIRIIELYLHDKIQFKIIISVYSKVDRWSEQTIESADREIEPIFVIWSQVIDSIIYIINCRSSDSVWQSVSKLICYDCFRWSTRQALSVLTKSGTAIARLRFDIEQSDPLIHFAYKLQLNASDGNKIKCYCGN